MSKKKIQFFGAMWCGDCHRSKNFLDDNKIKYDFHNTDEDEKAADFVRKTNKGMSSIPTIVFPDGDILVEPTNQELGQKLGLEVKN